MIYEFPSVLGRWRFIQDFSIDDDLISDRETEIWRDEVGLLSVSRTSRHEPNCYRLRFSDEVVLDILADRKLIIERSARSIASTSTRDHFLADQVLPRILAHEGKFVLHAAASRLGDRAIILMGASGLGKSTLAASFDRFDGSLLGDDALVVSWEDAAPCISAVYPSLRLLPDSVEALFREIPLSTAVASYTNKQRITLPVRADPELQPVPIAAIFVLAEPSPDPEIRISRLSIGDACMACITNSFALDPTDTVLARKKLQGASALAHRVPAFEIRYPRDYARLPDVHAAIFAQVVESSGVLSSED